MPSLHEMKTCLKCGHTRTAQDAGPDYACPACGAVYAKLEAAQRAKETIRADAEARRQAQIEQEALEREPGSEPDAQRKRDRNLSGIAHLVYALYVLPIGLSALIGLVIAYVMRTRAAGTWVESHFRWQIGTFWRGILSLLAVYVAGELLLSGWPMKWARRGMRAEMAATTGLAMVVYGLLILVIIWCIYRVAKGWISLLHDEAVA